MKKILLLCVFVFLTGWLSAASLAFAEEPASLDGAWSIAMDPENLGVDQHWEKTVLPQAVPCQIPSVLQQWFPEFNGLVWYWRTFDAPALTDPTDRFLLHFEQVDYFCTVWINEQKVGSHEGGETPFSFDVTPFLAAGKPNRIAVRVLNPTHQSIDGITLRTTAHRMKTMPFRAGNCFNYGGITMSVELRRVPAVYVGDLFVKAGLDGKIRAEISVRNASKTTQKVPVQFSYGDGRCGETFGTVRQETDLKPGENIVVLESQIENPRRWELNSPYLYRGTAKVGKSELSTRFGVREFLFSNGYFRLNGKRLFLKETHTGDFFPVGLRFPNSDPDLWRRDLLNLKAMGFNMIRFIWGGATQVQLDYCDEIGLLVYDEFLISSNAVDSSPQLEKRFHDDVEGVIRRDRNHPSVVLWGLLNEVPWQRPHFPMALNALPWVQKLDGSRMVFLNSGRCDTRIGWLEDWEKNTKGWCQGFQTKPFIGYHQGRQSMVIHPGLNGEKGVVRWTVPAGLPAGTEAEIHGKVKGDSPAARLEVVLRQNGKPLFSGKPGQPDQPGQSGKPDTPTMLEFQQKITLKPGDCVDLCVGRGPNGFWADFAEVELTIQASGPMGDLTKDFSAKRNPNGDWSYGFLPAEGETFWIFLPWWLDETCLKPGTFANPGEVTWNDGLEDYHTYPDVPHDEGIIHYLRSFGVKEGKPCFPSEYGIGSAVDLIRTTRHFEELGMTHLIDAKFYRGKLDQFYTDWERWNLRETFDRPEDFFAQSLAKMAAQRTLGLTAIRANPANVGHGLTGATDQGMAGEGLTTTFRELKPGTFDAIFDVWAPLRWNVFVSPWNVFRGKSVHLSVALSNEDVLPPGNYAARAQVFDAAGKACLDEAFSVTIQPGEPPFAQDVWELDLPMDVPEGTYRFVVTFEKNAAAAGGEFRFFVGEPAKPANGVKVSLWNEDELLKNWLEKNGFELDPASPLILVSNRLERAEELDLRVQAGATVLFLCGEVFQTPTAENQRFLAKKAHEQYLRSWLYLKDEWSKPHPYFAGLPSRGLMDTFFYRELISGFWFVEAPEAQESRIDAVAGAIQASLDYSSGLTLVSYRHGRGILILNTFKLRENLEQNPAAGKILSNILQFHAAKE